MLPIIGTGLLQSRPTTSHLTRFRVENAVGYEGSCKTSNFADTDVRANRHKYAIVRNSVGRVGLKAVELGFDSRQT
jgi:hypothetical protein